jgi:hypothetical protein
MPKGTEVAGEDDLKKLYSRPSEVVTKAPTQRLHPHHRAYSEKATFFTLATVRDAGLDVSPRGGPPGFVRVIDNLTIAFGDCPGKRQDAGALHVQIEVSPS